MYYGFIKVACVSPRLQVANTSFNAKNIIDEAIKAANNGAKVIVFPELSISGYTCGDLFFQQTLLQNAEKSLTNIIEQTKDIKSIVVVGLPFAQNEGIYNVGAIVFNGKLLALVAKTFLPNYSEFYERRQFTPFNPELKTTFVDFAGFTNIPFGTDIIIKDNKNKNFALAVELCEDLWVPLPPSTKHALNGATIIANLSAGNEIIGKSNYRRNLVKSQSAHTISAYMYANAGKDESTQDMIFAGHNLISENGTLLAESTLFNNETIYASIDLERLAQERRHTTSFGFSTNNSFFKKTEYTFVNVDLFEQAKTAQIECKLDRFIDSKPFVPSNQQERNIRCSEVISLQSEGLAKRLRHINCKSAVVGLSGGLDSTLALLVTAKAFDLCKIPRSGITAITMPCFGTTSRTYNNACKLANECGATLKEIQISKSVLQHFSDIGQDEQNCDITYENSQARERTQVLMDYANKTNGIVIGTGDLSELALGWCTYNGDQMSMYGVNSSIPKTLVRYLVEWFAIQAKENKQLEYADVLFDILDTPVSPELLPAKNGTISQVTEDLVGPYELHDFFLYYVLRFGFSPAKIFYLAKNSELAQKYDCEFIKKWLKTFYKRFFTQQFKRSCMPDGAKVGTVNLSPRGDWRMPSDASAEIWLKEVDEL